MALPDLPQVPLPKYIQANALSEQFIVFSNGDGFDVWDRDGTHIREFTNSQTVFDWIWENIEVPEPANDEINRV